MKTMIILLAALVPLSLFAQDPSVYELKHLNDAIEPVASSSEPPMPLLVQGKANEDDLASWEYTLKFASKFSNPISECTCSTNIGSRLMTLLKTNEVPSAEAFQHCESNEGKSFGVQSKPGKLEGLGTALVCGMRVYEGTFNPDPVKPQSTDKAHQPQPREPERPKIKWNMEEWERDRAERARKMEIEYLERQRKDREHDEWQRQQRYKNMPEGGGHGK